MREKFINIVWLLPLMVMLSCDKTINNEVEVDGEVYKTFSVSATRATNDNNTTEPTTPDEGFESFADGDAIRIGLFKESENKDELEIYSDLLTTDIYAVYNSNDWEYGFGRKGDETHVGYKVMNALPDPILAACYPYRDANDLKNIPFNISNNQGIMWSESVAVTNDNRDAVPLKFHHSTAKITINVTFTKNDYSSFCPVFPKILGLQAVDDTPFYVSADYDATTGEFDNAQQLDGIFSLQKFPVNTESLPDGYSSTQYYTSYNVSIYLIPIDAVDPKPTCSSDKIVDIRISWISATSGFLDGLTITRDMIQIASLDSDGDGDADDDDEDYFKAGYEYTYNVKINNSIMVDNVTFNTAWIDDSGSYSGNI